MLKAFANCWKVPELRARILVSLGLLFIARIGANIPLPGIDTGVLEQIFSNVAGAGGAAAATFNMFTGGAVSKGAIFALGVMPYISASIIMQLMGAVVPSISKLQQEGEMGRQKVAQYSRYLTITIALVQGVLLILLFLDPQKLAGLLGVPGDQVPNLAKVVVMNHTVFVMLGTTLLVAGSMIVLWLGEQMTERGIGNGTSILITVNILADIPAAIRSFAQRMGDGAIGGASGSGSPGWGNVAMIIVLFFVITAIMVALTQAVRKVPVQYAKRIIGQKIYGGQASYLPLKLIYAGVMPVIFAGAITTFPPMILGMIAKLSPSLSFLEEIGNYLNHVHAMNDGSAWHGRAVVFYTVYSLLIFGFSYFWVSLMFKPTQIADDLKKANGYIPGIRPGRDTALFLDFVMTRLTLVGSFALLLMAVTPDLLVVQMSLDQRLAYALGGTGGLITVGVVLDTVTQMETMLLQRRYEGFLKSGRLGGVTGPVTKVRKDAALGERARVGAAGWTCLAIFVVGFGVGVARFFTN